MKFKDILTIQFKTDRLSHAYLIFEILQVDQLLKIFQVKKPDLFFLQESPIKINHIRELTHWINLKPHSSFRKLAILLGVENLTLEAANALLKVLEEPPLNSVLVLQAGKIERVLPTILSRCQIIKNKVNQQNYSEHYLRPDQISSQTIKERFEYVQKVIEKENLSEILNFWEESFRQKLFEGKDTRKILEEISRVRRLLLTNVSVKLLLENLLLKF